MFYSTPSSYVDAVKKASPKLTQKSDDLLPYASSEHSFWNGFYTSRPTFKGFVRQMSALFQVILLCKF